MSLNNLMKQAQQMQEKMEQVQRELSSTVVVGEAGAGLVKIEMTCAQGQPKVHLDPGLLDEDIEILEDLLAAAISSVLEKIAKTSSEKMKGITAGLNLPKDLNIPMGD